MPQGRYRCDCEAGVAERACWHQAAVFIAKVEHAGGARVTGPGRRPAALPRRLASGTERSPAPVPVLPLAAAA